MRQVTRGRLGESRTNISNSRIFEDGSPSGVYDGEVVAIGVMMVRTTTCVCNASLSIDMRYLGPGLKLRRK